MPSEEDIARDARERPVRLERELELAAHSTDTLRRETAFVFLLPELLQVDAQRLVALVERQPPGAARDLLRTELARYWINRDAPAALTWMKTLGDEDRRAAGVAALEVLRPIDPEQARRVALELGVRAQGAAELVQAGSPD